MIIAQKLIEAETEELRLRRDYLKNEKIETIYFGGGTPSVLKLELVALLTNTIYRYFQVKDDCEITFECNPDDLTKDYLKGLKSGGINRISIGVQSFNDQALKFIGRRHSAEKARNAVVEAIQAGFNNISIDLIFGIPGVSFEDYKRTLKEGIDSGVQHISVYQLTYEEGTLLHKEMINNNITEVSEDENLELFDYTMKSLEDHGFNQYEVSNYSRAGYKSKHNWLYWSNGLYMGVGPSAHSYDGETRQWNVCESNDYIKGVERSEGYFRIERLTDTDKYNEYVLTALRTSKGISEEYVLNTFDTNIYQHFVKITHELVYGKLLNIKDNAYVLSKQGIFILDLLVRKLCYQ